MASREPQWRPFSNPAPLGNSGFAVSIFATSLHTGAIGIASGAPLNIVVGLALFFGGMAQLIAGAWSFASNSSFGAAVFTSYGCYWMAYAATMIPVFGIAEVLNSVGSEVRGQSWGIFNLAWTLQTFIFLLASLRSNWGTVVLLLSLLATYVLATIGHWTQSENVMHASGYVGLVTALIAWYNVAVDMLNKETFYCELPNPAIGMREPLRNAMPETPGHSPHDLSASSTASHFGGQTPGNNYDFVATIPKHTVSADIP